MSDEMEKIRNKKSDQGMALLLVKDGSMGNVVCAAARLLSTPADQICAQLKKNSETSDRLAKRLWWLNFVLTAATIVGAFAAAGMLYLAYLSFKAGG